MKTAKEPKEPPAQLRVAAKFGDKEIHIEGDRNFVDQMLDWYVERVDEYEGRKSSSTEDET